MTTARLLTPPQPSLSARERLTSAGAAALAVLGMIGVIGIIGAAMLVVPVALALTFGPALLAMF